MENNNICKQSLFFILSLVFCFSIQAQSNSQLTAFQKIQNDYKCKIQQQESVIVQTSSYYYFPGERMYFKLSILDNYGNLVADGSNYIYFVLTDINNNSIHKQICKAQNGQFNGIYNIPDSLRSGLYKIIAYTNWMQNKVTGRTFEKPILIISHKNHFSGFSDYKCDTASVNVYCESNNLLQGIDNELIVRVDKMSVKTDTVQLVTSNDSVLSNIIIDEFGIGRFTLNPAANVKYFAKAIDSKNAVVKRPLPEVRKQAYKISIEVGDHEIIIKTFIPNSGINITYLGLLSANYQKSYLLNSNASIIKIPKKEASGVVQFLLFNNDSILSGRLWYQADMMNISNFEMDTLKSASLSTIQIPLSGNNEVTDYSVNIVEYNDSWERLIYNEISIIKYFDLYNALDDFKQIPFFNENSDIKYVNACLIAAPYFRFITDNQEITEAFQKEKQGVIIRGSVYNSSANTPLKKQVVLIASPDSICQLRYIETDINGNFQFVVNDYYLNKPLYFILKDNPINKNSITIKLEDKFQGKLCNYRVVPETPDFISNILSAHKDLALTYKIFNKSDNVPIIPISKSKIYKGHFYGNPDNVTIPDEYEALDNFASIIRNLVFNAKFDTLKNGYRLKVLDLKKHSFPEDNAFVMLNNIPYPDNKSLSYLKTENISRIELKQNSYKYGDMVLPCIMAVFTNKPIAVEPLNTYITATIPLFNSEKNTVEDHANRIKNIPDLRHTIIWNKNINSSNGKIQLTFNTPDIKSNFRVSLISTNQKKLTISNSMTLIIK